ncbi:hypothetical protein GOV11_01340 [Candidatus Woesearchaeota archaeon]|nr:hypothetical protein [Candidatus Woesearchaeota archaeon]
MKRHVLVFCAHSDDQALGCGGYLSILAKEGAIVKTIICSFGEQSHPHLKPEEIKPTRVLESQRVDKLLGGSGVQFLGLKEGKFSKDIEPIKENLIARIRDFKPELILTHSSDDPHPDHRAVHKILLQLHQETKSKAEIFTFDVWNMFNLRKRHNPRLIINITNVFKKKLDAIDIFRSQRHTMFMLLWSIYVRAIFWGLRSGNRYAEVYYKVR